MMSARVSIGAVVVLAVVVVAAAAAARRWRAGDRFTLARTRGVEAADGLRYRVHLAHDDPGRAAETLAELNRRATELMRHLRRKYLAGPGPAAGPRARAAARLLGRYNPDNLAENSPRDPEGDTSYTIAKGAILALCLRGARRERIHDAETLTFVTLHELTHIAVDEVDHPPRFWQAFKFILAEAVEAGLLLGVDYARAPVVYCGMAVDYNPLFDRGLRALGDD